MLPSEAKLLKRFANGHLSGRCAWNSHRAHRINRLCLLSMQTRVKEEAGARDKALFSMIRLLSLCVFISLLLKYNTEHNTNHKLTA